MRVEIKSSGAVDIVNVDGRMIGSDCADLLRERVRDLLATAAPLLILDLSDVPEIDSACLGELVACRERVRKGDGVLRLVLGAHERDEFADNRLDRLFEVYASREDALQAFMPDGETAGIP